MDAELPAYLLETKLRWMKALIMGDENSAWLRWITKTKIKEVINILVQIGESERKEARYGDNRHKCAAESILDCIQSLDDNIDRLLIMRRRVSSGYCLGAKAILRLVFELAEFKKMIIGITPEAAAAAKASKPREPLLHRGPPIDWTRTRRDPCLDWNEDYMPWKTNKQSNKLFRELVYREGHIDRVVILQGCRGAGKTTLMRSLYNRADIIQEYDCRAWVSIHGNLTYTDVLLELVQQIKENGVVIDHMKEEDELVEEIFTYLSGFERYLIVLDDCTPVIWPRLMECLPENGHASRVVITTPESIGGFLESRRDDHQNQWLENHHFLKVIQMKESYTKMYQKKESDTEDQYSQTTPEGTDSKHAELPRQLYTSASSPWGVLLLDATQEEDNLDEGIILDYIAGGPFSLEMALKFCYHNLHPLVKVCFLFLSIFPKGSEVPLRRVRYLWFAEGFLHQYLANQFGLVSSDQSPPPPPSDQSQPRSLTELARICLEILVKRKLVEVTRRKLDGTPKCCRIPTFVHDFSVKTFRSTGLFNVYNHRVDGNNQGELGFHVVRRVASHADSEIPSESVHRHLRAYVSFHNKPGGRLNEEISVHLKTLTRKPSYLLLKLLDLEGVYKPKLPDSIGVLLCLRFLGLRSTLLDSLPTSIAKLQCLETLDLKHTNVVNVPGSLLRSKRLHHLHAKEVPLDDFCHPKWLQSSSSNLETLTGLYIGSPTSMKTASQLFRNLRELEVTFDIQNPSTTDIQQFIEGMTHLQALKFKCNNTDHVLLDFSRNEHLEKIYLRCKLELPEGENIAQRLPKGLRELTLSMSELTNDPMPAFGELRKLVVLRLLARSYLGTEMNCTVQSAPELRVLKLWGLPQLTSLSVQPESMSRLQEMEIRSCPEMTALLGLENVGTFEQLVLDDMEKDFEENVKSNRSLSTKTIIVRK